MTLRARPTRPTSRTTRLRRMFEGEERQQAVVTAFFVLAIAAIVVILIGVIALAFYEQNIRPLARVASVEVGPQLFRDRLGLEQWRITTEQNRLTEASINNEIDAETLAARSGELEQRAQALSSTGLEDLVDLIYQSQLAPAEGITVTEADVDARMAELFAGVEKRHVLVIAVEPKAAEGEDASPTIAERRLALEKAEEALAAVQAGGDWAEAAREFGTDEASLLG